MVPPFIIVLIFSVYVRLRQVSRDSAGVRAAQLLGRVRRYKQAFPKDLLYPAFAIQL
jgi:hypothetical protein